MFIQLVFYDRKICDKLITSTLGGLIPDAGAVFLVEFCKMFCFKSFLTSSYACFSFLSFLSSLKADWIKYMYTEYRL